MIFVFGSVDVGNYIYRLAYVEPALHSRDESYLIMVDKLFDVLLACQYFILFVATLNGSSLMIWLSVCLLLMYRNACDILHIAFVS